MNLLRYKFLFKLFKVKNINQLTKKLNLIFGIYKYNFKNRNNFSQKNSLWNKFKKIKNNPVEIGKNDMIEILKSKTELFKKFLFNYIHRFS